MSRELDLEAAGPEVVNGHRANGLNGHASDRPSIAVAMLEEAAGKMDGQ
jgi:hypothetical protein